MLNKMETHIVYSDRVLTVELCGEVDHHISQGIRERIDYMLDECVVDTLIFDFSRVIFMDSSGIGIILGRYNKMAASGGKIITKNAGGIVKQILEMSGIFEITEYEEDENGQEHSQGKL